MTTALVMFTSFLQGKSQGMLVLGRAGQWTESQEIRGRQPFQKQPWMQKRLCLHPSLMRPRELPHPKGLAGSILLGWSTATSGWDLDHLALCAHEMGRKVPLGLI